MKSALFLTQISVEICKINHRTKKIGLILENSELWEIVSGFRG